MNINIIIEYIQVYGYVALFFLLWLGIVGLPIPDEVVVMTGGFVTSNGLLHTFGAFLVTYLGVISGLSIGYFIGRIFGNKALNYLAKKKNMSKYIDKTQNLIDKYGYLSLVISYFIPVVRHIIPYIVGTNKMKFATYATYSYSAGLLWTAILFIIGKFFGNYIEVISSYIRNYGWIMLALVIISLTTIIFIKKYTKKIKC